MHYLQKVFGRTVIPCGMDMKIRKNEETENTLLEYSDECNFLANNNFTIKHMCFTRRGVVSYTLCVIPVNVNARLNSTFRLSNCTH